MPSEDMHAWQLLVLCVCQVERNCLFCSTVGIRSGKYAQQLIDQGFPHVYNLKGSIVAWVSSSQAIHNLMVHFRAVSCSHNICCFRWRLQAEASSTASAMQHAHQTRADVSCHIHCRLACQCFLVLMQSQEGYPLVKNDGKQTPTKQVHTFGKTWDLVGDGYESVQFGAIQ